MHVDEFGLVTASLAGLIRSFVAVAFGREEMHVDEFGLVTASLAGLIRSFVAVSSAVKRCTLTNSAS